MATRLKTVEYWFPLYTSTISNTTDTSLTQITIYLPESSKTFKSVNAHCVFHDLNGGASNVTRRQLSLQLGSAGYSVVNNTQAISNGGENWTLAMSALYTSYFTTNWSGTSMTCDFKVLFTTAQASPVGFTNVSVKLTITYEYDDTSSTHIKTVRIPLNMPTGTLGTSKPSAIDTIPQLTGSGSPLLVENSPTVRQMCIVVQGNTNVNATTDRSYTMEVDSLGTQATANYEHGTQVDQWIRFNQIQTFSTTASHSWYIWSSLASLNHGQAWLVVTYEFTVSGTTSLLNSLLLIPDHGTSPFNTVSEETALLADLWIEEPTTITTKQIAGYFHWTQISNISGLSISMGLGTGSYTDSATVLAGMNGCMLRYDSAVTLARGKNTISAKAYRTDTGDLGWGLGAFFIVNYTSGVPSGGPGAANHTVEMCIECHDANSGTGSRKVYGSISIPETDYFITNLGQQCEMQPCSGSMLWFHASVNRLSGEGGVRQERVCVEPLNTDPEIGILPFFGYVTDLFQQWPGDPRPGRGELTRMDIESSTRYWTWHHVVSALYTAYLTATYHTITFTKSITVGGYGGTGTGLTVEVFNLTQKFKIGDFTTTTGSCTAKWYDSVDSYYAICREDSTHVGRSDNFSLS